MTAAPACARAPPRSAPAPTHRRQHRPTGGRLAAPRSRAWTTTPSPPAARPPTVPPGGVEVRRDEDGAYLTCGHFDDVTTELLRVGYRGEPTLAVHDRLYPQVRQLIRELLEELRCELAELDPRLTLTSIND